MWKSLKWALTTIWGAMLAFAAFLLQTWVSGKPLPNLPPLLLFLSTHRYGLLELTGAMGLLAAYAFNQDTRNQLEEKTRFFGSTSRLRPSDINPNAVWFDPSFLERPAVRRAIDLLTAGKSVILIGVPLIGKTRCAFECLRRVHGYHVLIPEDDQNLNTKLKLPRSLLWRRPKVILFLDDLHRFIGRFSPSTLLKGLRKQSRSLVILSTCRSGQERAALFQDELFAPFTIQNFTEIKVEELSKGEEATLASHFNRPWSDTMYNGTPGSIAFGLDVLREQFRTLPEPAKALMRSMSVMNSQGIQTFRIGFVELVTSAIHNVSFTRSELNSGWQALERLAFVVFQNNLAVLPHRVYVETSIGQSDYILGSPKDPFAAILSLVMQDGEVEEIRQLASGQLSKGDYTNAALLCRKVISLCPKDDLAWFQLGYCFFRQDNHSGAEQAYRESIRCNPNSAGAYRNLGIELHKLDRLAESEQAFHQSLRLDPNDSKAHVVYAILLWKSLSREAEAVDELRAAIRCDPTNASAHTILTYVLNDLRRDEEAEPIYRALINLEPNDSDHYRNFGCLLSRLGLEEEAATAFQTAIRLNPDDFTAHYRLGLLWRSNKDFDQAVYEIREALRIHPEDVDARLSLALTLKWHGRLDEAESEFRAALVREPDNADGHRLFGVLLLGRGRNKEAVEEFLESLRLDRDYDKDGKITRLLHRSLQGHGNADQIIKSYVDAIQSNVDTEAKCTKLALLLDAVGRHEDAERYFTLAKATRNEQPTQRTNPQAKKDQSMPNDTKPRIFVSHSSKDKAFVRALVEALTKHLLNVWVDEHELTVGDSLVGKISAALKGADYLVIVLSKASASSPWVQEELNAALANQIAGKCVVLPVLLEDCEVPMLLKDRLYADFRTDFNVGLEALLSAFKNQEELLLDHPALGLAAPVAAASFSPTGLREQLQKLLTDRMSRTEVGRLWYAVLETRMDDEMAQRPKSDCVVELLAQAKDAASFHA